MPAMLTGPNFTKIWIGTRWRPMKYKWNISGLNCFYLLDVSIRQLWMARIARRNKNQIDQSILYGQIMTQRTRDWERDWVWHFTRYNMLLFVYYNSYFCYVCWSDWFGNMVKYTTKPKGKIFFKNIVSRKWATTRAFLSLLLLMLLFMLFFCIC